MRKFWTKEKAIERARDMAARPPMWAETREGFLFQLLVILEVMGMEKQGTRDMLNLMCVKDAHGNAFDDPSGTPTQEWVDGVVQTYLAKLNGLTDE